jgi:hypothetical protein
MSDVFLQRREINYTAFWGRPPNLVHHASGTRVPHIGIYRFPPLEKRGFFRTLFAAAPKDYVYISGGMSEACMEMPRQNRKDESSPTRVELTAFARTPIVDGSGEDVIASWLAFLAHATFQQRTFLAPGHAVDVHEPLTRESSMSAFFFGITPDVDMRRLCEASIHAELMLHVTPISEAECALAKNEGAEALLNAFERAGVEPVFDVERKTCV